MERKNAWKTYTADQRQALDALCESYKEYISEGKTERECTVISVDAAKAAGFVNLEEAMEKGEELEKTGAIDPAHGKAALLRAMDMKAENEAEKAAKIGKVKEIYEALGIDEDVKYEIIKLHAQAMNYAGLIGLGKVRYEMLHRYADRLIGRNK